MIQYILKDMVLVDVFVYQCISSEILQDRPCLPTGAVFAMKTFVYVDCLVC